MGFFDGAAGGIAGGIGGLIGGAGGNRANRKEAERNRQFQKASYGRRYQETVLDMTKAGINPILAAGAGLGGGSSPSGSTGPQSDIVTPAISSAISGRRANQELKNMKATARNIEAQTKKTKADTAKPAAWAPLYGKMETIIDSFLRSMGPNSAKAKLSPFRTPRPKDRNKIKDWYRNWMKNKPEAYKKLNRSLKRDFN